MIYLLSVAVHDENFQCYFSCLVVVCVKLSGAIAMMSNVFVNWRDDNDDQHLTMIKFAVMCYV